MIVAGVGCRRGAPAADIEAAITAALSRAGIAAQALDAVATIAAKENETGIKAVAEKLRVELIVVPDTDVQAVSKQTQTRSARVLALMGVPSVAETAALVAAGPQARLLGPRLVVGAAACALAACEDGP